MSLICGTGNRKEPWRLAVSRIAAGCKFGEHKKNKLKRKVLLLLKELSYKSRTRTRSSPITDELFVPICEKFEIYSD